MKIYVAVFKSRTDVLSFSRTLTSLGIVNSIIPTPKEAKLGCGNSVKFPPTYLNEVKNVINKGGFSSFYKILKIEKLGSRVTTTRN